MGIFLFIIFLFIAVLAIGGPLMFLRLQKGMRLDKNYERGIDMVPLLISLPPISDDTDGNGRDVRDVVDENISKAQIIYNILASTIEKNRKNRIYGQRHFSFELIGSQGFVHFYVTVPADMVAVIKQAFVSAYPSARLEPAAEHQIFNRVGGLSATVGGELTLKQSYAYPIATYQDLKRDALQGILNSLATLDKEDGVGIQLLVRPADDGWRKHATELSSKKRKGEDKTVNASMLAKQMMTALVKPPEGKEGGEKPPKELSALEQSVLDAIDDKTRHAGFETTIRIVVSSNISQRSQGILNNVLASFSLFDAPGKNGFKFTPAKDISELTTAYILRFFSHHKKHNILNSVELATLFHFPDQNNTPTSQVERQESKQVDGPRNVPDKGLLLGFNVFRGVKKPIRLGLGDRQRHMYAVGQTGTGKSTFLENLALQDMLNGDGFAFVDPHGDTVEKLLSMVPKERVEDVIYFNPSDMDYPMGLNLFEFQTADQKDFLIQEALNMLYKLYDPQHQGIMGPRYEHLFRNAALTVMADPAGGSFVDIPKLFRDPQFVKQKLEFVKDLNVREFWEKEMPQSQRSNEFGDVVSWFVSKFGAFLSNEMMRNIIGQTESAFDLREIMDKKKILLVNLSKGRVGELNSKLLGMVFVMKFQAAAMSRSNVPEDERIDFCLYVDEFQNFSTDSFATIMSEARKYHLNLIVANQFTTQLTEEIRDAVFGNIGTIVSFRVGQNDVESLGRYFQPQFDGDDLVRVPNANTIVRTLVKGVPTQPFSMATLPPLGNPNPKLGDALKQLSAAKYGKPKNTVETAIFARLATKEPEPKPFSNPFGAPGASTSPAGHFGAQPANNTASGMQAAPGRASGPAASNNSFLDEWLAKQRSQAPTPNLQPRSAPPVQPAAQPIMAQPVRPAAIAPATPLTPAAMAPQQMPSQASPVTPLPMAPTMPTINTVPSAPTMPDLPQPGNISSAQLDQQEIDDIAHELKHNLHQRAENLAEVLDAPSQASDATAKTDAAGTAAPASNDSNNPAGTAETSLPDEATIHLKAVNKEPTAAPDDTIFIDTDGVLHSKEKVEPEAGTKANAAD